MIRKTVPMSHLFMYPEWHIVGYENFINGDPTHAEIEKMGFREHTNIPPIGNDFNEKEILK